MSAARVDGGDLRAEATPALEKMAAVFRAYPAAVATIEGHADSRGDDRYNQELSERRAASVRGWLAGHGASHPIATRGWHLGSDSRRSAPADARLKAGTPRFAEIFTVDRRDLAVYRINGRKRFRVVP